MHKTRQIHYQFQKFSLSKRNENFKNWLRSDQTQSRNVHNGNVFVINKSETNEVLIFSRCKKRTKNETLTPAISLNRRIAHLGFHYTEG